MLTIVAYCSAGTGHKSAALVIQEELERAGERVILVDILDFGSPFFRFSYAKGYAFFSQHLHALCAFIYKLTDYSRNESHLVKFIQNSSAWNVSGFLKFVQENKVERVICTHFLPASLLAQAKKKAQYTGQLETMITDYEAHGFWAEAADKYYVASEYAVNRLKDWGFNPDYVILSGIAVRSEFTKLAHTRQFDGTKQVTNSPLKILFVASAIKTKLVLDYIQDLIALDKPIQLTLITAHNKKLYDLVSSLDLPKQIELNLQGYVSNMYSFMAQADLFISKPGGLTASEALRNALPMIFIQPIPMQENYNAEYLEQKGIALLAYKEQSLKTLVSLFFAEPERLRHMSENCLRLTEKYANPNYYIVA